MSSRAGVRGWQTGSLFLFSAVVYFIVRKSVRGVFNSKVGQLADGSQTSGALRCSLDRRHSVLVLSQHSLPSRVFLSDPAVCFPPRCGVDRVV